MALTIDSSVFVSAVSESEAQPSVAYYFLEKIIREKQEVIIPVTVAIEATLAIARRIDKQAADKLRRFIFDLPNLRLIELDFDAMLESIELGMDSKLKGMDAIVVYVAKAFNAQLAALDKEMISKARPYIQIYKLG